jgi:hypothetical protein
VFCVLGKVFRIHTVARKNSIAVKLVVLFNNLLRRTAYFAIRARAVKNPIDDVTARGTVVAIFIPRP